MISFLHDCNDFKKLFTIIKSEAKEYMKTSVFENVDKDLENFFEYLEKEYELVEKCWLSDKKLMGFSKTNNSLERYNRFLLEF